MRARLGFVAAGVGATSSLLVPSSFVFTESESTFRVRETSRAGATSGETAEGHGAAVVFAPAPPPKTHPNAKLVFVQVLTRHGDRTSINPLPSESKQQWRGFLLDDSADAHLAKFAAPSPVNPKLLDTRRTDMYGTDTSWHGQLTTQGEAQLRATGASIRKWLVESDAHGARSLLPVSSRLAFEQGAVTIRATACRRTVQSAQALVSGLYPSEPETGEDSSQATLPIQVRDRFKESMFPNPGMACVRQTELIRSLDSDQSVVGAEQIAWQRRGLADVRALVHLRNLERRQRERAAATLGTRSVTIESAAGEASVASVAETGVLGIATGDRRVSKPIRKPSKQINQRLPSATSVWEPLQALANHRLTLPMRVTPDDVTAIRAAAETRYVNRATNREGASLAGGRLLEELAEEILTAHSTKNKQHKLSIYSGHDSSILALLAVLGAFPGRWPPVASTVVVETWEVLGDKQPRHGRVHWSEQTLGARQVTSDETADSRDPSNLAVRVLFNGEVLTLDGCVGQDSVLDGRLVSLSAFVEMARARNPEDYAKACESIAPKKSKL